MCEIPRLTVICSSAQTDKTSAPQKPYSRQSSNSKLSQAELQAKINSHLNLGEKRPATAAANGGGGEVISDESKEDEKSDIKVIDSTDEKTGVAVRTSIENRMKTNENVKVCKAGEQVDVQETDDAIIKKITTKTRTTKSVVKTTTTTTTKKGTRAREPSDPSDPSDPVDGCDCVPVLVAN